jgi:hypothetical protein
MFSPAFPFRILKPAFLVVLTLGFGGVACDVEKPKPVKLEGAWIYRDLPCAIFREGKVLLVVNERGSLGTAVMTGETTFVIKGGQGWDVGLIGTVSDGGKWIQWSNSTAWSRGQ